MEYKSKKEEKFDSIYRAHVNSVLKAAMHYTKDYDTAQEVTQMAFIQLYKHFDNVDFEYVLPWLLCTTKNMLFNYNRSAKNEILGEVVEIIMETVPLDGTSASMEDRYMRKEQKRMAKELSGSIFEKLYKKNVQWYEAIMLAYCLEKPQQEVAEELGITYEVLRARLTRAKRWIRKIYEKEYEKVVNWF